MIVKKIYYNKYYGTVLIRRDGVIQELSYFDKKNNCNDSTIVIKHNCIHISTGITIKIYNKYNKIVPIELEKYNKYYNFIY